METRTAHFSVHGDGLTRIVRGLATDGRWEHALRVLRTIDGLGIDDIEAIIDGRRAFTGVDNLEVVDANDEEALEHRRSMQECYAGCCRHVKEGVWMRPYAVVTNFGKEDFACTSAWNARSQSLRALHYADDASNDAVTAEEWAEGGYPTWRARGYNGEPIGNSKGGVAVLWRRCQNPPYWYEGHTNSALAWDAWLAAGHRPEERGWTQKYGSRKLYYAKWETEIPIVPVTPALDEARAERIRERDAEDKRAADAHAAYVHSLQGRAELVANGYPCVELDWGTGRGRVPRALLAAYAVYALRNQTKNNVFDDALKLWVPTAPQGLKLVGDDVWHSDICLLLKLDLQNEYPLPKANGERERGWRDSAYPIMRYVQRLYETGGVEAVTEWVESDDSAPLLHPGDAIVLCGSGSVVGRAVHPGPDEEVEEGSIVVVPNADAAYYIAAVMAHAKGRGAVICETGGALSHLCIEGMGVGFRIVRVENARALYPPGTTVRVDLANGLVFAVGE